MQPISVINISATEMVAVLEQEAEKGEFSMGDRTIVFKGYWTPAIRLHHSGYYSGVAREVYVGGPHNGWPYVEWRPVRKGNLLLLRDIPPDAPCIDSWSVEAEERGFCVFNGKLKSNSGAHLVETNYVDGSGGSIYRRKRVIKVHPGGWDAAEQYVLRQPDPQILWYNHGLQEAWLLEERGFMDLAIEIDGDVDKYEEEVILPGWRAIRLDREVDEKSTAGPFQMKKRKVFGVEIWCDILIQWDRFVLIRVRSTQHVVKDGAVADLSPGWWKIERIPQPEDHEIL